MTARTVSIKSRQATETDGMLLSSDHEMPTPSRPRIRLKVRKPPSIELAPAEDDTIMDDASISDTTQPWYEEPEENHWAEGLICFCRKPEGFTSHLIACDGPCQEWYHNDCVNLTDEEANKIDKFYCPICVRNGFGRTVWKKDGGESEQAGPSKARHLDVLEAQDLDLAILKGFPRQTAIERKREHRKLSRRQERLERGEVKREKRWDEGRGARGLRDAATGTGKSWAV